MPETNHRFPELNLTISEEQSLAKVRSSLVWHPHQFLDELRLVLGSELDDFVDKLILAGGCTVVTHAVNSLKEEGIERFKEVSNT